MNLFTNSIVDIIEKEFLIGSKLLILLDYNRLRLNIFFINHSNNRAKYFKNKYPPQKQV